MTPPQGDGVRPELLCLDLLGVAALSSSSPRFAPPLAEVDATSHVGDPTVAIGGAPPGSAPALHPPKMSREFFTDAKQFKMVHV